MVQDLTEVFVVANVQVLPQSAVRAGRDAGVVNLGIIVWVGHDPGNVAATFQRIV